MILASNAKWRCVRENLREVRMWYSQRVKKEMGKWVMSDWQNGVG